MLTIEDLTFDVADATIHARVEQGTLLWNVSIQTVARKIDGQTWRPHAYIDDYPAPSRSFADMMEDGWSIPDARALSGGRLLPGQANCGLYVFEHDFVELSRLRFTAIGDGIVLTWTGRCSAHWSDEYDTDLAFVVEAPIEFLGFWVPAESERAARNMIDPLFDVADMELHRSPGKKGSYFVPPER